ncbi:hypothetical protein NKG05_30850 [Oerskovia sp. M15]
MDRRDELRTLRKLAATMTQTQIAKELRISQPAVNKALKAAGQVPDVREGSVARARTRSPSGSPPGRSTAPSSSRSSRAGRTPSRPRLTGSTGWSRRCPARSRRSGARSMRA